MTGETSNGLLTVRQVADLFQVKVPRVYEMVRDRRLRAVRIGRQLRFRTSALERFLERHESKEAART